MLKVPYMLLKDLRDRCWLLRKNRQSLPFKKFFSFSFLGKSFHAMAPKQMASTYNTYIKDKKA